MKIEDRTPLYQRERRIPKFGDSALFYRMMTSKAWGMLLSRKKFIPALALILAAHMQALVAALANLSGVLLRYRHGSQSMGVLLMLLTLNFLLVGNAMGPSPWLKPLWFFVTPFLPFFREGAELNRMVFRDVHSSAVLTLAGLYTVAGVWHLLMIYFGKGNPQDSGKRGQSWLYEFLFKRTRASEHTVQGLLEPILIASLAFVFYTTGDVWMSWVLGLSAGAVFIQENLDHGLQLKMKPPA